MTLRELKRTVIEAAAIAAAGTALGLFHSPEGLNPGPAPAPAASPRAVDERPFIAAAVAIEDVRAKFESGVLFVIDARRRADFEAGHVPGAFAADGGAEPSLLRRARRLIPADVPLVLIMGRDDNDLAAVRLASTLRQSGLANARTLKGGMAAWVQGGLPTVRGWDMDALRGEEEP